MEKPTTFFLHWKFLFHLGHENINTVFLHRQPFPAASVANWKGLELQNSSQFLSLALAVYKDFLCRSKALVFYYSWWLKSKREKKHRRKRVLCVCICPAIYQTKFGGWEGKMPFTSLVTDHSTNTTIQQWNPIEFPANQILVF